MGLLLINWFDRNINIIVVYGFFVLFGLKFVKLFIQ